MMFGVVWAGRGFGMVLNRDDGEDLMAHAFDAAVVEVDMRHLDFGRQAIGVDGEAVIV